jgi:hypothetical protein
MRRLGIVAAGLALAAILAFAAGAFALYVWPGAKTEVRVRTEAVEKTWGVEDRCEKAWTDFATVVSGGSNASLFWDRVKKVCPSELMP